MGTVETVLGPVDTADLGRTYMHEHVFVLDADVQQNYPAEWGSEDDRVADAVGKLKALAAQGVRSIADPTVVGLGRYIPRIQRIAEQVPELNIIAATGCYTYDQVPFFFFYRGPALSAALGTEVPDPMVDMFVADITEGIAGTGVKAAFLKCAIDHQGMTDGVARIMRAVARAHRHTGAPITVHTHPGHGDRPGREEAALCDEEGVDPTRVVLGHSGDSERRRPPERPGRRGLHPRHGPFRDQRRDDLRGAGRDGGGDVPAGLRRSHGAVPRRGLLHRHDRPQRDGALMTQWNYLHIHDDVLPYIGERRRDRRPDRRRCSSRRRAVTSSNNAAY